MKKTILAFLASFALVGGANAAPVSFDFQAVPLVSVMQATYKGLLKRDYVISPDVLALDKRVSLNVKGIEPDAVGPFVDRLLADHGVLVQRRADGIYYLALAPAVPPSVPGSASVPAAPGPVPLSPAGEGVQPAKLGDVKLFRPENRTVDFMVSVVNAAFGSPIARAAGHYLAIAVPADQVKPVLELCETVDTMPRTVEVSASFVEVATTASQSSGLALAAEVLGARIGVRVGSTSDGSLSVATGSFSLVMDALSADGRFKQVSNSRVVGDDAEKMNLTVGDETPTLQASGRDNTGNVVNSVVYRSSGVILDVLPKVLGSGRLALSVDGQVSSFKPTTTGVVGSPTLSKRQVKTAVTVGDGQVLVIGGLEDASNSSDSSGLSFLPRSWAGGSRKDQKTDLILILSAKIIAHEKS